MKELFTILCFVSSVGMSFTQTYVDASAMGADNGQSWSNAYTDLGNAIYMANPGDTLWVKQGMYFPTVNEQGQMPVSPNQRYFWLKSGVVILGGFTGQETMLSQRDPVNNKAILNGNNQSYHVLEVTNIADSTAVLDGFMVADGLATGNGPTQSGGGLYLHTTEAQFYNVRVTSNSATYHGAGLYAYQSNCRFVACEIDNNNTALYDGPAGYFQDSDLEFFNCLIRDNQSNRFGGIACSVNSNVLYQNCTFVNNSATNNMFQLSNTNPTVDTFAIDINHSIIYDNTSPGSIGLQDAVSCNLSDTWSDWGADSDPLFNNSSIADYSIPANSPCVDPILTNSTPYNPYKDLAGNDRVFGANIDYGAFEYIDISASIYETNKVAIVVYPNPSSTHFNVGGVVAQSIELYTIDGKLIVETEEPTIRIENLSTGAYFLKVTTPNQTYVKQVVKN